MSKRTKRARRSFTEQFKADAVELVRNSGKSIAQIAVDLDLTESSLREWVHRAENGGRPSRDGREAPAETESAELARLREENRVLRMERDFLKKATAFFAKESK